MENILLHAADSVV